MNVVVSEYKSEDNDDLINKNKAEFIAVDSCVQPDNILEDLVINREVYVPSEFQTLHVTSKKDCAPRFDTCDGMTEDRADTFKTKKQTYSNEIRKLRKKYDRALKNCGLCFDEAGKLLFVAYSNVSKATNDMENPDVNKQKTSECDSDYDSSDYKLAVNSFDERFFGKIQTLSIEESEAKPHENTGVYDASSYIELTNPNATPKLPQLTTKPPEAEKQQIPDAADEKEEMLNKEFERNIFQDFLEESLVKSYKKSFELTQCTTTEDLEPTTYELEKFERNDMIIFNHENFLNEGKRRGTALDVAALENTFKQFRFDVDTHHDLTEKKLFLELRKFSRRDFTSSGCICVAILTHGQDHGYLRASDIRYCERDVIACFDGSLNPSLVGKPILFLIQACRGRLPAAVVDAQSRTSLLEQTVELDAVYPTLKRRRPMDSDIIMFHSSFFGRASIRVVEEGTWFIQTLCEQIQLHASTDHLEKLFRRVRTIVATMEYEGAKQMPVVTSTLLKKLYLKKALAIDTRDVTNFKTYTFANANVQDANPNANSKVWKIKKKTLINSIF